MGRGEWGEGFSGTRIKNTGTKPSGRVEAGRDVCLAGVGWRGGEKMQTTLIVEKQ